MYVEDSERYYPNFFISTFTTPNIYNHIIKCMKKSKKLEKISLTNIFYKFSLITFILNSLSCLSWIFCALKIISQINNTILRNDVYFIFLSST